ncbi:hypothetical protein IFM89_002861 [Coptis chinensis]|uniref:Endonuclease/exonuclease/phosphatase domain-containing protein n=1 Tax=Coptis chinensis TaxID=261450 RepID=A0A835LL11_9MAGN|nr:hypothetical protein IFM89_002861 [Coptis chinensis]
MQNAEPVRENKVTDSAGTVGTEHEHISNSAGSSDASLSRIHEVYAAKTLVETEAKKVLQMIVRKQHYGVDEKEPPDPKTPTSRWGDMAEDDVEEEHDPTVGLMGLMVNDTQESDLICRSRNRPQWQKQQTYPPATRGIANDKSQNRLSKLINKWDPDIVGIAEPMISPDDFSKITVEVDGVLLSIIHAHCNYVNRRQLWMDLHQLSLMNLPWLILGDFNTYLSYSDKQGGHRPSTAAMSDFRDFVGSNHLMEAPCIGFHFSWWNKQVGRLKILGKLDRMFFNILWSSKYLGWNYKEFTMQMMNQENKIEQLLEQEQMFGGVKRGAVG